MFRITRDPSSGSFIQCLAKIAVMVLSRPLIWVDRSITVIVPMNYTFVHMLNNKVF